MAGLMEAAYTLNDSRYLTSWLFGFFHEPRKDQRTGGGVGILVSDQFKTDIHSLPSFETFEAIFASIGNNSFSGSLSACIGFKTVQVNF